MITPSIMDAGLRTSFFRYECGSPAEVAIDRKIDTGRFFFSTAFLWRFHLDFPREKGSIGPFPRHFRVALAECMLAKTIAFFDPQDIGKTKSWGKKFADSVAPMIGRWWRSLKERKY